MASGRILITGASGQLGRLILANLVEEFGVSPVDIIATTRHPDALTHLARKGMTVRAADFDEPASLAPAFAGAQRALIISTSPEAPYVHGKRLRQQTAAIDAAVAAGVEHAIYTSAPNPEPGTPCFWKQDHYDTELALIASGLEWTILRHWEWPDWHFTEAWLPALESGRYLTATGSGTVNHVTREDCARAAAGALVSDSSRNRRFDITGAEALSADAIMGMLGEIAGKPVDVVHVTPEELEEHLLESGTNPLFVPVFVAYARGVQRGLYGGASNAVEELSGRKPTHLRDFVARALRH